MGNEVQAQHGYVQPMSAKSPAQAESMRILNQMHANNNASSSTSIRKQAPLQQLQEACQQKPASYKSVTFVGDLRSVVVTSSDPHILLQIALFYVETAGGMVHVLGHTHNAKKFGANFQFKVKLTNACTPKSMFGEGWAPIIIDYMNETYPMYRFVSGSTTVVVQGVSEKLYFVPTVNNGPSNDYQGQLQPGDEGKKDDALPNYDQLLQSTDQDAPKVEELPLPAGWSKAVSPGGRVYYKNNVSRTTQWEHPLASKEQVTLQ